jgi:hypothetical protein
VLHRQKAQRGFSPLPVAPVEVPVAEPVVGGAESVFPGAGGSTGLFLLANIPRLTGLASPPHRSVTSKNTNAPARDGFLVHPAIFETRDAARRAAAPLVRYAT